MSMMDDLIGYGRDGGERGLFGRVRRETGLWLSTSRERRTLAELPDHILLDIGITRAEAEREARRPFWAVSRRS